MKKIMIAAALLLASSTGLFAAYDNSWYQTDYWSGEYPNGFSVVKKNTVVKGRAGMDKDLAANIDCKLPYKAVFQHWNEARNKKSQVSYFTASKIVNLVAAKDFDFPVYEGDALKIKKGDLIEYLIYGSEGMFLVRIKGSVYEADQELFENVEAFSEDALVQDEWLQVKCENGSRAWLFMNDLVVFGSDGELKYLPGLAQMGPGLMGYGEARDLTDAEAKALASGK